MKLQFNSSDKEQVPKPTALAAAWHYKRYAH